jgi:maltose alpha-D-glucosyltransferase/alpha-amylase
LAQTVDSLRRFYEAVATLSPDEREALPDVTADDWTIESTPLLADLLSPDLNAAARLGETTAALHQALASNAEDPAFRPEALTTLYQRSLYQSLRTEVRQVLRNVRRREGIAPEVAGAIDQVLDDEQALLAVLRRVAAEKMEGVRIRCHGDYRLDEVLFTGTDYVIFDFTGDTTRRMSERRIKASPARDLAEMLRSLDYAAQVALLAAIDSGAIPADAGVLYGKWAAAWSRLVGDAFVASYLAAGGAQLVPAQTEHLQWLLDAYVVEKAVHELQWEVDHRPHLVGIPLAALRRAISGVPAISAGE